MDHEGLARNVFKKPFRRQRLIAQEIVDEILTWQTYDNNTGQRRHYARQRNSERQRMRAQSRWRSILAIASNQGANRDDAYG